MVEGLTFKVWIVLGHFRKFYSLDFPRAALALSSLDTVGVTVISLLLEVRF